jgi:uncharacterized protein YhaN
MRFAHIRLRPWGSWLDRTLSFREDCKVHVIFGPNEAGKSTIRRAMTAFLFGMNNQERDTHSHKDVCIEAALRGDSGSIKIYERRKKLKNALTYADGSVALPDALAELVGSPAITKALFEANYALDHQALREGGQALLEGKGELGQALFQASMGGKRIFAIKQRLEKEAAEIFSPRAIKKPLNESAKAFDAAKRKSLLDSTEPSAIAVQEHSLDEVALARQKTQGKLTACRDALRKIERLLRVREPCARREALRQNLRTASYKLPESAREIFERAKSEREGLERLCHDLALERQKATEKRASILVDASVIAEEVEIALLARELSSFQDLSKQGDRVVQELEGVRIELTAALRTLRADASLTLDASGTEQLAGTLEASMTLLASLSQAKKGLAEVADLPEAARLLFDAATADEGLLGQLELANAVLERATMKVAAATRKRDALTQAMPGKNVMLPAVEVVEVAERAARSAEEEALRVSIEKKQLEDVVQRLHERLAIHSAQATVTREELLRARVYRDTLVHGEHTRALVAQAIAEADHLADRLLDAPRESDGARTQAELSAKTAGLALATANLKETQKTLENRKVLLTALLGPVGAESITQLRAMHERALQSAQAQAMVDEEAEELHAALASVASLSKRVCSEFEVVETDPVRVLARARARNAERKQLAALESQRIARMAERARQADLLRGEIAALENRWSETSSAWSHTLKRLGLTIPLTEAQGLQAVLRSIRTLQDRCGALEQQKTQVTAGLARFLERLEIVRKSLGESLAHPETLLGRFEARLSRASSQKVLVQQLDEELARIATLSQSALEGEKRANAKIEPMLVAAGVQTEVALELLLAEEQEQRRAVVQLRELEELIVSLSEGLTLGEILEESSQFQSTSLSVSELRETRLREIADLEEQRDRQTRDHEARLQSLRVMLIPKDEAAATLCEAYEHLAKARELGASYLLKRVQAGLLAREVERYRSSFEQPVLRHASSALKALTLGAFERVGFGYGDGGESQLVCYRAGSDSELHVDALSEGTRDQLYLALRLASLVAQSETGTPITLPLLLDDVFVHFDDERTQAAIALLASHGPQFETFYFTHHERFAEQAANTPGVDLLRLSP